MLTLMMFGLSRGRCTVGTPSRCARSAGTVGERYDGYAVRARRAAGLAKLIDGSMRAPCRLSAARQSESGRSRHRKIYAARS